jgi:hypothetical protein
MSTRRARGVHRASLVLAVCACACSSSKGGNGTQIGPDGSSDSASPVDAHAHSDAAQNPPKPDGGASKPDGGTPMDGSSGSDGGLREGWLYTVGNGIVVADGPDSSHPWFGRGVNIDDIFLCGYDDTLWMTSPDMTLETIVSGLVSGWKPSFVRISLGMDSNPTVVSWLSDPTQYATPMTSVINAIGANPGVYVLVTLRSDASMIGLDEVDGDPEATGLPSDSTTTPDATTFPMGTDPVYVALVDTFGKNSWVIFGLTNEPGGDKLSDATISAAMSHAVGVIRAEEDRLHLPHHLVSVQGNGWTSDISFYSATPLPYDNVVYEVHGYPPTPSMYTYSNIPVIIGEYGSLTSSTAATLYADLEAKGIPNLAWDFEPYSNCAPDLLSVTDDASTLTPTSWGSIVQGYLTSPP